MRARRHERRECRERRERSERCVAQFRKNRAGFICRDDALGINVGGRFEPVERFFIERFE